MMVAQAPVEKEIAPLESQYHCKHVDDQACWSCIVLRHSSAL
jgi:hypothetical protein